MAKQREHKLIQVYREAIKSLAETKDSFARAERDVSEVQATLDLKFPPQLREDLAPTAAQEYLQLTRLLSGLNTTEDQARIQVKVFTQEALSAIRALRKKGDKYDLTIPEDANLTLSIDEDLLGFINRRLNLTYTKRTRWISYVLALWSVVNFAYPIVAKIPRTQTSTAIFPTTAPTTAPTTPPPVQPSDPHLFLVSVSFLIPPDIRMTPEIMTEWRDAKISATIMSKDGRIIAEGQCVDFDARGQRAEDRVYGGYYLPVFQDITPSELSKSTTTIRVVLSGRFDLEASVYLSAAFRTNEQSTEQHMTSDRLSLTNGQPNLQFSNDKFDSSK